MTNERKLELTLCGLVPHKAKCSYTLSDVIKLSSEQKDEIRESDLTADNLRFNILYSKPLLHSLDKLTEPILEGGFIPVELILNDWNTMVLSGEEYKEKDLPKNPAYMENWIVECLKEWHFNIYDLPKEMYIEKSTLNL